MAPCAIIFRITLILIIIIIMMIIASIVCISIIRFMIMIREAEPQAPCAQVLNIVVKVIIAIMVISIINAIAIIITMIDNCYVYLVLLKTGGRTAGAMCSSAQDSSNSDNSYYSY